MHAQLKISCMYLKICVTCNEKIAGIKNLLVFFKSLVTYKFANLAKTRRRKHGGSTDPRSVFAVLLRLKYTHQHLSKQKPAVFTTHNLIHSLNTVLTIREISHDKFLF